MNLEAILKALTNANASLVLATDIAGTVVPLGKFVVNEVKTLIENNGGVETITYQVALQQGQDDIASGKQDFTDALTIVNEERKKAGLEPLVVPT